MAKRCQVCGMLIKETDLNCPIHQHIRKKSLSLAQYLWQAELGIISTKDAQKLLLETPASDLAERFGVSISTVYRHLKLAGFTSMKGWVKKATNWTKDSGRDRDD